MKEQDHSIPRLHQLNPAKQRAGRLGGLMTASRHDMREIGRKGGRPRALTLKEMRAR